MRRIAVAVAVVAATAALAFAATLAQAAAPVRFTDHFENSDTIDCSQFNPEWTFNDDFTDFFDIQGQIWFDANGDPIREIDHAYHVSNDVNSVTGFTLHEHNHFIVEFDFVNGTVTLDGAINIMQRRAVGEVIQFTGHKIFDLETGDPIELHGPDQADDEDFCAAVAP